MSLKAFSKEEGVALSTLHEWKKRYSQENSHINRSSPLHGEQRFAIVLETATLSEEALNTYCRERGYYRAEVDSWRAQAIAAMSEPATSSLSRTLNAKQKTIKSLEKELVRKEKALVEAATLLVLQKKFAALYKESEDV